jgi:hypothetical protein
MATNENNPCTCTTPEYTIILNQQGPSGRQGATGQNGFSPIIAVGTNTRDTYNLVITTADGVITTPNLISEPIPSGGINGQVLTNFGNDVYGWGTLPNATTESQGVVYLSTDEDFQPDEEGNVDDTTACTPQTVVDYVQSVGLPIASTTTLGGIKVGDGLSITDDGVLSASGGGSELNHIQDTELGVQIDDGDPIPQTGTYYYKNIELRSVSSASISDPSVQIEAYVYTYQDGTLEQRNQETIINVSSGQFSVGNSNTQLRLHSSDEIQAEVDLGVPKVVTTGLRYKTLTSTEYEALSTKDADTMYRLTDTNEVYLGTIPLTGGASAQYKTLLINNYDNATQTNLGGSTTVQVTDTEV